MSVNFSSSKQAAVAMAAVREMRSDLNVEPIKQPDTTSTLLSIHFLMSFGLLIVCKICELKLSAL